MSATDSDSNHIVTFDKDGVSVKEIRESPFSGEEREVAIDELDWDSFPIDRVTMEVVAIEPVPSENDEGALSALQFEVSRLEHNGAEDSSSTEADFWRDVEAELGIRNRGDEIELNGDTSAKANLVHFVEYLFRHGHISEEDIPYKSGYKWYLLNSEPTHQDPEDDMYQAEENTDGVWLETKDSHAKIKEKSSELADEFVE
jgi:hypothetical protein